MCATKSQLGNSQLKSSTKRKYLNNRGYISVENRKVKLNKSLNPSVLGHSVEEVKHKVSKFLLSESVPVEDKRANLGSNSTQWNTPVLLVPEWAR